MSSRCFSFTFKKTSAEVGAEVLVTILTTTKIVYLFNSSFTRVDRILPSAFPAKAFVNFPITFPIS